MASLGSLVYKIKTNNSDFKRGMNENRREIKQFDREVKKSQGTLKKYSERFKQAGIALTTFGAIVTGVGFKLARLAADANEIQSRFNHVFGQMAKDANKWAENFAENFGQSRSEIKSMMATLQDTLVPMGVAADRAYELNKRITQLALDMSSFADIPLKQAMSDIQSALVGQSEPMRKYGSILTETRVKQFALANGIVETDRELTEQEKILARVQLMFQDMNKAQGDYSRTSGSFNNRLRATGNRLRNIGETLGSYILPEFNTLLGYVEKAVEWFGGLPVELQKNITKFALWSGIIAGIVGPLALIVGYLPQIKEGIVGLKGAFAAFGPGGMIVLGLGLIAKLIYEGRRQVRLMEADVKSLTKAELQRREELIKTRIEENKAWIDKVNSGDSNSILGDKLSKELAQKRINELKSNLSETESAIKEIEELEDSLSDLNLPEVSVKSGEAKTPRQLLEEEMQLFKAQMTLNQKNIDQYKRFLENKLNMTEKYSTVTRAMIKRELDNINHEYEQAEKELNRLMSEENEVSAGAISGIMEKYGLNEEFGKKAAEEIQNVVNKTREQIEELKEQRANYLEDTEMYEIYNQMIAEVLKQGSKEQKEIINKYLDEQQEEANEKLQKHLDERLEYWKQYDKAVKEKLANDKQEEKRAEKLAKMLENPFVAAMNNMGMAIEKANEQFLDWQNNLVDGLSNAIARGKSLSDVFSSIADQISAMVIKKAIVQPFVSWGLGELGIEVAHTGGLVTSAGVIPRMHSGGPVLKHDEVPAILQTGERVLSREQNKEYESGKTGQKVEVYNIQAVDAPSFQRLLAQNKASIINITGEDIAKNGQLRKLINKFGSG